MNPYLIIGFLVALLGAGAGGFKLGIDHEVASHASEEDRLAKITDAVNMASAQAISKIKVVNQTINSEVQRETQTNTIYSDCRHSPLGLQLLNEALSGSKSASNSNLPKTIAPNR